MKNCRFLTLAVLLQLQQLQQVTAQSPIPAQPYTWRNVVIYGGGFVTATIFSRSTRDVRFLRTDMGGAYRWNASSETYEALQDDTCMSNSSYWGVLSLAIDPTNASRVLLATGLYTASWAPYASVLISERGGDAGSWMAVPLQGVKLGGNQDGRSAGERLAIDGNAPASVWLGSSQNGVWHSANGGYSWTAVASWPSTLTSINFVFIDDSNPGASVVYVAANAPSAAATLYASSDNGASWAPVAGQPSGGGLTPYRAALDRFLRVLYVTYAAGVGPNGMSAGAVFALNASSGSWRNVTPPANVSAVRGGYAGVAVDATRAGVVMVTTMDRWYPLDGILRSLDGGATWRDLVPASGAASKAAWVWFHRSPPVQGTGWMGDIALDPFNGSVCVHTTGQGVWTSLNVDASDVDASAATNWTFADAGVEQTVPLELVAPPAGSGGANATLLSALGDIDGFVHTDVTAPSPYGMFFPPQGSNAGLDVHCLL